MTHRDVFVVSTARTAIGTFGGTLKDIPNTQLATTAVKAAIQRSGLAPDAVGHVVMGNVIPTDTKDAYLSRVAAIDAGCPIETPAFNVNRLCGSGLQAIISAAQAIGYGDCDVAVGGGSESMSRGPYFDTAARYGARMGDAKSIDYMLGILHDPWQKMHMGITAENVAERYKISREMQDQLACESQRRAAAAIAAGYFKDQIVPVEIATRKGTVLFHAEGAGAHGPEGAGHGPDRSQRSLRRPGLRRGAGAGPGPRQGQPQRLGHFARPPGGRHGRHHHHQGDCRAAPHGRALRARHHVHWRRPGHCGHLRAGVINI